MRRVEIGIGLTEAFSIQQHLRSLPGLGIPRRLAPLGMTKARRLAPLAITAHD